MLLGVHWALQAPCKLRRLADVVELVEQKSSRLHLEGVSMHCLAAARQEPFIAVPWIPLGRPQGKLPERCLRMAASTKAFQNIRDLDLWPLSLRNLHVLLFWEGLEPVRPLHSWPRTS